jgi:hypothetical protein
MKHFIAIVTFPMCLLQAQHAVGDCAKINREVSAQRSAFIVAKENYKRDTALILGKPLSKEAVELGIIANTKMVIAIDELVDILNRSLAERCFGADAMAWKDVIAQLKAERDAIEKITRTYIGEQDGAKRPH